MYEIKNTETGIVINHSKTIEQATEQLNSNILLAKLHGVYTEGMFVINKSEDDKPTT